MNDLTAQGGQKDVFPEGNWILPNYQTFLVTEHFTPGPLPEGLALRIHPLLN